MKPRRVIVTIEMDSDMTLKAISHFVNGFRWEDVGDVHQVQTNSIRPGKKKAKK